MAAGHRAATAQAPLTARGPPARQARRTPAPTSATARQRRAGGPTVVPDPPRRRPVSSAVPTTVTGVEGSRELTLEEVGGQPRWRDLPRIGVAGLVSTISALPASVQGRWAAPLLALETALVGGAAGVRAGTRAGLTAAAAFLVGTAMLAVAVQAVILVVTRASPRRRLLADVTPAYVASLTLRPYRLDGGPAWYAANYTAWPRGQGHRRPHCAAAGCAR